MNHPPHFLQETLDRITDGIVAFDSGMNYVYVNRRAGEFLGRKPEELVGKNYWKEFPEARGTPFANACVKALERQEPIVFEDYNKPRNRWFENRIYPSKEGLTILLTDTTGRKGVDEGLIGSERRYRTLFENMNAGFVLFEVIQNEPGVPIDLLIVAANKGFEAITGLTIQKTIGKHLTHVLPGIEKDPANWIGTYGKIALTGEPREFVAESQLLGRYYSITAYQPVPKQCAVTFIDITERKRAEEELRKRERLLSESQRIAHIGSWAWDLRGPIQWTDEVYRLHGVSPATFTPTVESLLNLIHPDDRPVMLEWIRACAAGEQPGEVEARIVWPDGTVKFLLERGELFLDENKPLYMAGTVQDITERKRAEKSLRESEQRYRLLFEEMFSGYAVHEIICNPAGKPVDYRFLAVNAAFEKLTGLDSATILGRTVLEVLPALEPVWIERYGRVALQREPIQFEHYTHALDKYYEVRAFSPEPGKFATIFNDITERKRAEEEIHRSNEQLSALTAHLQTVIEEERARIAREIHDDIGQIFTAIKMDLSLLLRTLEGVKEKKVKTAVTEEVHAIIELLDRGVQSIRKVVRDLRPETLETLGLLAGIEWQAKEFEKRAKISVSLSLPKKEPKLEKQHSVALFRIVQEVLTNVARHAQATKVKIHMTTEQAALRLETEDNGRGISENDLHRPGSFGLLAMQERIHSLGGEVTISGKPGKGTRVEVRLERVGGRE